MGVKDLWNIVSPLCDTIPLYQLQNKILAVDLSCWVVENQTLTVNCIVQKSYLTMLYFRTVYLLQNGIFPVFIIEGKAPELKQKVMSHRQNIRYASRKKETSKPSNRNQFNAVLKNCEEMLKYLGLACFHAKGEAEAFCAYLNNKGLVDGCISQDSDCFLYGAKTVYRNFCMSKSGGTIDVYEMSKIEEVLQLGRNKMIALALICGCDYDDGLNGIGKEAALKLFKNVSDEDILERIKSWKYDNAKFEHLEEKLSNPNICTSCGHFGKLRVHLKKGCSTCGTTEKCNDTYKETRATIANELAMRKKALATENFPSQDLIDEFLNNKDSVVESLDLQWKQPKLHKFIAFMERHVDWDVKYSFPKIFSLLTRWQLENLPKLSSKEMSSLHFVQPQKILKIRSKKGIASYEILWRDDDQYFDDLIALMHSDEDEKDEAAGNFPLITIEPQTLINQCYPNLVTEYQEANAAKRKNKAKKDTIPRKRKKADLVNNRNIDEFLQKRSLEDSLSKLEITPKRKRKEQTVKKRGPQIDRVLDTVRMDSILNNSLQRLYDELTPDDFPSELEDNVDVSLIIDQICGKEEERQQNVIEFDSEESDREIEEAINSICSRKDEFSDLDESYVPLDKRVKNKQTKNVNLGISELFNTTEEEI